MKLIMDLKRWLKQPGNTMAKLAVLLEYNDSAPIKMWLTRRSVPSYQQARLRRIVTEGVTNECSIDSD